MSSHDDRIEQEGVELLAAMMGGGVEPEDARKVLRKHKGNVQKAAEAILGGDRGEGVTESWNHTSSGSQNASSVDPRSKATSSNRGTPPVIDLTADDDEDFSRAIRLSMETQQEPHFGPSDRAPDPAWQMVPANVAIGPQENPEDRIFKDAIQASLEDFHSEDQDTFPVENTLREGGRPIVLRAEVASITYAAFALQALFHIPQVRKGVANLQLPDPSTVSRDTPEHFIWALSELFTNLDLAQLSCIVDKEVLPTMNPLRWNGSTDTLGELTATFLENVGDFIERRLNGQRTEDELDVHLFQPFHGQAEFHGTTPKIERLHPRTSIVNVDTGHGPVPRDLISRLSTTLSRYTESGSVHNVIFEPSQAFFFHLKALTPYQSFDSTMRTSADYFVYPRSIYLDQFLVENLNTAHQKRTWKREIVAEIDALTKQREFITNCNNRDTIKDLKTTLHYYEHVAESKGDSVRQDTITRTTKKLKNVLESLLKTVAEIDKKIEKLREESANLFDDPELQKHRYDLRAVLMHTGLPGRKQMYSYVQDTQGTWWKTIDYAVTEAPEEMVLTDSTGIHLGAGPYMLFYSRHLGDEELKDPTVWPQILVDNVEKNNQTLFSLIPSVSAGKQATQTDYASDFMDLGEH